MEVYRYGTYGPSPVICSAEMRRCEGRVTVQEDCIGVDFVSAEHNAKHCCGKGFGSENSSARQMVLVVRIQAPGSDKGFW